MLCSSVPWRSVSSSCGFAPIFEKRCASSEVLRGLRHYPYAVLLCQSSLPEHEEAQQGEHYDE